jgi:hypothetical protein
MIDQIDYLNTTLLSDMARILPAFQVIIFQKRKTEEDNLYYTSVFSALSIHNPEADILCLLHTEDIKFDILRSKDENR